MKLRNPKDEIQSRTWQMSFNDLLTILLTFFILLVSMSNINMNKVQNASLAVVDVLGLKKANHQQDLFVQTISAVDGLDVYPVKGGVSIVLPESMVYGSGSAEIIHKDLLQSVGQRLNTATGAIRVEGHTDSVPVFNDKFRSNWELSTQRAVNVVKFLVNECGIAPHKLSAAGYADSRPVASNDSPAGRALNRRVNLIISLK
jgi:chemotaxis protein MotB